MTGIDSGEVKLARVVQKDGVFGVEIPGYHFGREWDRATAVNECIAVNAAVSRLLAEERRKAGEAKGKKK